jgi:hypothetical protein
MPYAPLLETCPKRGSDKTRQLMSGTTSTDHEWLDGDGNLIDEVQVIGTLKPELFLEGLEAQDKLIVMKLQNIAEQGKKKAVPLQLIFSRP